MKYRYLVHAKLTTEYLEWENGFVVELSQPFGSFDHELFTEREAVRQAMLTRIGDDIVEAQSYEEVAEAANQEITPLTASLLAYSLDDGETWFVPGVVYPEPGTLTLVVADDAGDGE